MDKNATSLVATLERKADLSQAAPQRTISLRTAAEAISLHSVDLATCELLNEALARLVELCYQQDAGGFCNIDSATGRILIPVPFGRNGHARYLLRPQEGNILREILFAWEKDAPALLIYDRMRRSWFVNLEAYANMHLAKRWLTHHQISIGDYRMARSRCVDKG